ncbi:hypothetical protein [Streptomyces pseudovenezuelae]|uniref:hypothetical protein n=1 Tax=Streptomyces pseudovenezuelae TaxID=67350 RepID=UPI0024739FB4|nr:hypothetical protein [Streptomyces pseudovenezuelae]
MAPVFLLVACTSGSDADAGAGTKTSASPSRSNTQAQQEKKLTTQVQLTLDGMEADSDSMVASGVERVSDGLHTEPGLTKGTQYRLTVVCVGSGTADIRFTPKSAPATNPVVCDGSATLQRFTVAGPPFRIDVSGRAGATGMIGWRVDRV